MNDVTKNGLTKNFIVNKIAKNVNSLSSLQFPPYLAICTDKTKTEQDIYGKYARSTLSAPPVHKY